jgi:hypothetical protein
MGVKQCLKLKIFFMFFELFLKCCLHLKKVYKQKNLRMLKRNTHREEISHFMPWFVSLFRVRENNNYHWEIGRCSTTSIAIARHAIGWHFFRAFQLLYTKKRNCFNRLTNYSSSFILCEQTNNCSTRNCSTRNCLT